MEVSLLANALSHVERHAPNLRTLTLYFAPLTRMWPFSHSLFVPLKDAETIDSTLCRLRARLRRLSVVRLGARSALGKFEFNIAPWEEWRAENVVSRPTTLYPVRINALKGWQGPYPASQVSVWELSLHRELHTGDQGF